MRGSPAQRILWATIYFLLSCLANLSDEHKDTYVAMQKKHPDDIVHHLIHNWYTLKIWGHVSKGKLVVVGVCPC